MRERRWEEDEGSGDRDLQVHPYLFQITNSVDNPAAGVVNRGCLGGGQVAPALCSQIWLRNT